MKVERNKKELQFHILEPNFITYGKQCHSRRLHVSLQSTRSQRPRSQTDTNITTYSALSKKATGLCVSQQSTVSLCKGTTDVVLIRSHTSIMKAKTR